jgi:hypothetical protein
MALLVPRNPDDPDDLQLELRHATWVDLVDGKTGSRSSVLRREVAPLVREFLARLEAARRPLEAWLDPTPAAPAWGARFGPFGDRAAAVSEEERPASYQHKVDVPRRAGADRPRLSASTHASSPPAGPLNSASREGHGAREDEVSPAVREDGVGERRGVLLHGRAFRVRIAQLTTFGLEGTGERHDAALKLAYFHHVCRRLSADETVAEVRSWCESHRHVSATKARKEAAFVEDTLREVRHYVEVHLARGAVPRGGRPALGKAGAPLPRRAAALVERDDAVVGAVREDLRLEARAVLAYVATYADAQGRVPHPVTLSAATLERLVGQRRVSENGKRRRASAVAVEALEALGVLAVHRDYSVGRHGRQYTCWYRFGSGELPQQDEELGLVLGTRAVAEGAVVAVHGGVGEPPQVRFAMLREGLLAGLARPEAWWQRMYERRAFTPAEFFDAHERNVLPGPFRDRSPRSGARHVSLGGEGEAAARSVGSASMSPTTDGPHPAAPLAAAPSALSPDELRLALGCRPGCTCRLCWEGSLEASPRPGDNIAALKTALGCRPGCTCRLCWEGRLP